MLRKLSLPFVLTLLVSACQSNPVVVAAPAPQLPPAPPSLTKPPPTLYLLPPNFRLTAPRPQ